MLSVNSLFPRERGKENNVLLMLVPCPEQWSGPESSGKQGYYSGAALATRKETQE